MKTIYKEIISIGFMPAERKSADIKVLKLKKQGYKVEFTANTKIEAGLIVATKEAKTIT